MAFLNQFQIDEIKGKLLSDKSQLGKLFNARKSEYQFLNVDHSLVDQYLNKGWEVYGKPLKTKTKIRIKKSHSKQFEDDVWCQFYNLGFRTLNYDENFILPFSKDKEDTKQIDVIAINDETIFLIECKSSEKLKKAPSFKDEFELLGLRIDGFKKALQQIFGRDIKVKYIFATRNLRMGSDSEDIGRLEKTKSFYFNDNTYDYINSLLKTYKGAAYYQFLGLLLKNEIINNNQIEIPAVKGKMGKREYFMFSIEPTLLLKMGFVLHRTRANESEFPTYQRLLVPSRLKGISKFLNDGGYFPNSIIINFNSKKNKIHFDSNSKDSDSSSCSGTLKIPNSFGIAYIIDGQHRLYGYANSGYKESNTIPVVAFNNLDSDEQLKIFFDINQNQKAVSPSLRLDLSIDVHWGSDRADYRLTALRASITKQISNSIKSPLYNKITVAEDKAELQFKPFVTALSKSDLLPTARGNKYDEGSLIGSLYDINNQNHNDEMLKAQKKIVDFLILCYEFVEQEFADIYNRDKYFILSNRGTYAFICLLGSLNKFETVKANLNKLSSANERFEIIKKYLICLLEGIKNLPKEEEERQLALLGAGADTKWLRFFQSIINSKFQEFNPIELIDWKERQNEVLQDEGRKYGNEIEKHMKKVVLDSLKVLFDEDWELEINTIKTSCQARANAENEKNYKEGLTDRVKWTEMFNINDYKTIIEKYWTKQPDKKNEFPAFKTFDQIFSIDIGTGFNSKTEKLKWISHFNSYRNLWAHEGSKEKRLNKKEVEFLEKIHSHFYK